MNEQGKTGLIGIATICWLLLVALGMVVVLLTGSALLGVVMMTFVATTGLLASIDAATALHAIKKRT